MKRFIIVLSVLALMILPVFASMEYMGGAFAQDGSPEAQDVASDTPTATETSTPEPSNTSTNTAEPSVTNTATNTATDTAVPSNTVTSTNTSVPSNTATVTLTATSTNTSTATNTSTPSVTPTRTPYGGFVLGDFVRVNTDTLTLRKTASNTGEVIKVLVTNETGTIAGTTLYREGSSWAKIKTKYGTGYVKAQYLKEYVPTPTATPTKTSTPLPGCAIGTTKIVSTDFLRLRTYASTSAATKTSLVRGQPVEMLAGPKASGGEVWCQVKSVLGSGWVVLKYLKSTSAVTPTPKVTAAQISIQLFCSSDPERIIIANTSGVALTINSITTLYGATAAEPYTTLANGNALGTVDSGDTRTYSAGSGASGAYKLTSSFIFTNSAGDQDGVSINFSRVGTITKKCAASDPSGSKLIEVDLSEQRVYVWQGNTLVNTSLVSTGKPLFETPPGTYYIHTKYLSDDMQGCANGECWYAPAVPFAMYFTDQGHALHGSSWHMNFGVPVSHGCVNLPVPFAEWLYYWAPYWTKVVVHS